MAMFICADVTCIDTLVLHDTEDKSMSACDLPTVAVSGFSHLRLATLLLAFLVT